MKKLVIVESPTKAKTISKFLGPDFSVKSSFGHIRDLPKAKMGVDIEHDFIPQYVVPLAKKGVVAELKKAAKQAKTIYFATDGDREGEAISWHLASLFHLKPEAVKRLVFHEITKEAIESALENPRPLDLDLVNAQQARRIVDRLVGYELSPFLWKKVAKGLSAGRVQSVAVRLTVDREREIQNFKKEEHWTIEAEFAKEKISFGAKLHRLDGRTLDKMAIKSSEEARKMVQEIPQTDFRVISVEKKSSKRQPLPPFTTSTLQQEANSRLGFSAKQTMMLAQQLYEGTDLPDEGSVGLITYMRTDSVNLADKFISEARAFISASYGRDYLSSSVRKYQTKSKLAQEAHEAIRPTDVNRQPESLKDRLDPRQWKLYDLIWRRAMATQMAETQTDSTNVDISSSRNEKYVFRAAGSTLKFDGFLKIYPEKQKENLLPVLLKDDPLALLKLDPQQHFTEPPARYSDATLVKALEEYGIGRPSTYAPTISTIIARQYAERTDRKYLKPTDIGVLVTDILIKHFPQIADYQFTAKMEDDLDEIAKGEKEWSPVIREFYRPFHENLVKKLRELTKKELTEEKSQEVCEKCGSPMIIKTGRFGRFLACSKFPDCKNTRPLNGKGDGKSAPPDLLEEKCPQCGAPLARRQGPYGEFLSCSAFPKCRYIKKEIKSTGVKCPQCQEGEIIEKRTKRRRIFFSCSRWPECKFALWQRPTGEKCPRCGSLMVWAKQDQASCSQCEKDTK